MADPSIVIEGLGKADDDFLFAEANLRSPLVELSKLSPELLLNLLAGGIT